MRERWGEKTLKDSEERVMKMGKEKFKAICDNMSKGYDSKEVQELVVRWRNWLENFSHYSDEAVLGLGQTYSQHPEFAKFFEKYDAAFPEFFTMAIEHYCANKK